MDQRDTGASLFQRWEIGDVTITRLVEQVNCMPAEELFHNGSTREVLDVAWLQPQFVTAGGELICNIQALIVDTTEKRIMVDTCVGNEKTRVWPDMDHLHTRFLADLDSAGFAPDCFDTVLCTHLHFDHVGWNTMLVDGKWVPTFPNARYLINRKEYEYWMRGEGICTGNAWDEIQRQAFEDSVRPVLDAGLTHLVEGVHRVCDEVTLVPTVGHSPGHVSIRIESQGQEAFITGDIAHHPCQLAYVHWGLDLDFNPEQAIRTRHAVFNEAADIGMLVIGTHWAGKSSGVIVREGDSYRLKT